MKILNRHTKEIIFESNDETMKATVKAAICKKISLCGSDLRYSDLSRSDLSGSNLSGSDLRYTDLSHSDLSGSDLSHSDLRDSNLSSALLCDCNLHKALISYREETVEIQFIEMAKKRAYKDVKK